MEYKIVLLKDYSRAVLTEHIKVPQFIQKNIQTMVVLLGTSISQTTEHGWYDGIDNGWKLGIIKGTSNDLIVHVEEESEGSNDGCIAG